MSDIELAILDALARNTRLLQRRAAVAAGRSRAAMDEYTRQLALMRDIELDIERATLDALARNTRLLQRRAAVAARRAHDAMDECARQRTLINTPHTRKDG